MKITNVVRHLAVAETTILKNTKKIKTHRLNPRFSRSNNLRSFAPLFRFPKNKKKKRTKEKKERKLRLPADRKCRYQTRTICGGITGHTRDGLVLDCFFFFYLHWKKKKKNKNNKRNKRNKHTETQNDRQSRRFSGYSERRRKFWFSFFYFFPNLSEIWNVILFCFVFWQNVFAKTHKQ